VLLVSVINFQASHFARFFSIVGDQRSDPAVRLASQREGRAVTAVLWDLGGVLLDWDPRHLYRQLFGDDVARMEDFLANVCTASWHAQQDLGRPIEEACVELSKQFPQQAPLILAWAQRNEEMVKGPVKGSIELLAEVVEAGVPCYALTNMERESFERRVRRYEFFDWFDGCFVSGFEGVMKPDPRFFKLALERFALVPEETLFTDDKPDNVAAAAGLGVPATVFRDAPSLRAELVSMGVLT
jgi:2-haloacid dehalogenase